MTTETALPTGDTAAAGEQANTQAAPANDTHAEQQGHDQANADAQNEGGEGEDGGEKAAKKEKTPEQREIERLRRRVDNLTRRRYELEARASQPQERQQSGQQETTEGDDEPVTLSRAELSKMIAEQAKQLAPSIKEQEAEIERRTGVVQSLTKAWGKEEFDARAADLDAAFGGLMDRSGRPKPATDAIFEADDPKAVIEYLTDPDNEAEAQRIASLPAVRAGREVARIEAKLAEAKKQAKAERSNAPRPIEPVRGGGAVKGMPDPSDTKAYIRWANEQERLSGRRY